MTTRDNEAAGLKRFREGRLRGLREAIGLLGQVEAEQDAEETRSRVRPADVRTGRRRYSRALLLRLNERMSRARELAESEDA